MRRFLVTGGSKGLGLAICRELLAQGHAVVTCSRHRTPQVLRLARKHPGRFEHVTCDLGAPGEVARLARLARALEGLDGFVANAALGLEGLLTLTSEAAVRQCVEVNLLATMLLAREVLKGMLVRGGSLVFISSVAARSGLAGLSVYAATKGALVSFSRALAREYGERGVRSNCVLPGFLETDLSGSLAEPAKESLRRRTALKRWGKPADVVGAVCFLLSDQAAHVTGTELVVDGGMLA